MFHFKRWGSEKPMKHGNDWMVTSDASGPQLNCPSRTWSSCQVACLNMSQAAHYGNVMEPQADPYKIGLARSAWKLIKPCQFEDISLPLINYLLGRKSLFVVYQQMSAPNNQRLDISQPRLRFWTAWSDWGTGLSWRVQKRQPQLFMAAIWLKKWRIQCQSCAKTSQYVSSL